MGTYFNDSSDMQGDGLQTLILMNPHLGYSDTTPHHPQRLSNFAFPNSATANVTTTLSHSPQHIPLSTAEDHPLRPSTIHSQQHYISTLHNFVPSIHNYGLYHQVDMPSQQHGLSLTLSSQHPRHESFRSHDSELPSPAPTTPSTLISPRRSTDDVCIGQASSSAVSSSGLQSVLFKSRYLKAAQELLYEVVNVGTGLHNIDQLRKPNKGNTENIKGLSPTGDGLNDEGQTSTKLGAELTTVGRQEVHVKKAKLVNMLDEVEQRYRRYHKQMQIVISWFEQATGGGSAKPYTALALQTISKQFRCLQETIIGQIQAATKSLGEENNLAGWKMESSRLKFVDNQLRQQRALQRLGMIEHNAWRPKRGLPERSVSVLRAWLFEHFLHPYPKDSDKQMLAKQTGLTKSQVSNWFINARVRLWKPMVEEMYREEIKEHEHDKLDGKRINEPNDKSASKARAPDEKSASAENYDTPTSQNSLPIISVPRASISTTGLNIRNHSGLSLAGSSDMEEMTRGSPKKQRGTDTLQSLGTTISFENMEFKPEANNEQLCMKYHNERLCMKYHNDQRQNKDHFTLMENPNNYTRGFDSYPIGEFGRLGAEQFTAPYLSNGVSLTLGLPHDEDFSKSTPNQAFLSNQNIQIGRSFEEGEFGAIDTPTSSHSANIYENMNIQSRKRFATQLLQDFVA